MTPSTLLQQVPVLVLMAAVASGPRRMSADAACPVADVYEPAPVIGTYTEDGNLHWPGEPKDRSYPPSQYRRRATGSGVVYEVCACARKPCLIDCCEPDEGYEFSEPKCSDMSNKMRGSWVIPTLITENKTVEAYYNMDEFHILYRTLKCISSYQPVLDNTVINFNVSKNGSFCPESGLGILAYPGQFCLYQYVGAELHTEYLEEYSTPEYFVNFFARTLSLQFMLATFLVYAIFKKLRNTHGKSLMCNVASLFVDSTLFLFRRLQKDRATEDVCVKLAYISQFFALASIFWLNIMCFDLWRTFRKRWPIKRNYTESKRFIIYSIYAWGFPSLISILTYYMETSHSIYFTDLHPGFAYSIDCWFSSYKAAIICFYGPVAIILISNLFMVIHTVVLLYYQMEDSKIFNQSDSNKSINQANKQRFMLYLNLFFVMGVHWCQEITTFVFQQHFSVYPLLETISVLVDAWKGVFIFLTFVCKKRVFRLINEHNFGAQSAS